MTSKKKNMLIIKDEHGEIIGAQVEEAPGGAVGGFILPAKAEHTIHRVFDVPAEIHQLADPVEFHKAMTGHVKSGNAKIAQTSADELHAAAFSRSKN
jgi:hypothetical protein